MAAQPPSGIRLSAVSSREGWSGPCPRRAGRRASEGGQAVGGGELSARLLGPRRGRGRGRPSRSRRRSRSAAGRVGRRGPGCVPFLPRSVSVCPRGFWAGRGRGPSSRLPPGCLAAVVRGRGLGGPVARLSDIGAPDPSWPAGPRGAPEREGAAAADCGPKCLAALTFRQWDGVKRAGTSLPDPFTFLPLPSS